MTSSTASADQRTPGFLPGVRVIEIADELGEYCGKVLAGLGADVIKVEPLGGESTRGHGPFVDDVPDPDRSLYFWHYNFGKRSIVLDLESDAGRRDYLALAQTADVVLDTRGRSYMNDLGLGEEQLRETNPSLVYVRITPFGEDGPWADYAASDLIHLALGGVMMNCGYDPEPSGHYDLPPMAPQMWQSYHIVGEVTAIQTVAALIYARRTGEGQLLTASVHDAVSKNTETDLPDWVYQRQPHLRQTCRHSFAHIAATEGISRTKDGRWMLPYRTYLPGFVTSPEATLSVLRKYGMEMNLGDPKYQDLDFLRRPETILYVGAVIDQLIGRFTADKELWKDAQDAGLTWGPLRYPEENLADDHWAARETFLEVEHPELGRTFAEVGAKWYSADVPWPRGPRAPLLNEHSDDILAGMEAPRRRPAPKPGRPVLTAAVSKHGKPFALSNLRIVDLSWMLASGGAGRFFTALGADVIKVEHRSKVDGMRTGSGKPPHGLREERRAADGPIHPVYPPDELNRSGTFMELNAGKRSLSLNLKSKEGRAILEKLIADADCVIEGFSPGTMDRMGLGYSRLKEIKPDIIYVQQSGMGQVGTYGRLRSFGPTAQGFSGLSEMSGLPNPMAPAGIGYSYLDWFGAYQMATAIMAALYRRNTTGEGCWIDSSQVETGIYLTGTAVLDHSVNGRHWQRYGNRSPYKPAAPHGAFRAAGTDRWIAIACFTEEHWHALVRVLEVPDLASDTRFETLERRIAHQDELEQRVGRRTEEFDAFELMAALQAQGVPAGVCQTAEDRCETDPQLAHLGWQVELDQRDIGTWPVREVPVAFSATPSYIGGYLDRSGPSYGQDTETILGDLLGLSAEEIETLRHDDVI